MLRVYSVQVHTADFEQHTDITLLDVPKRDCTLSLFVGNVERELRRSDNRTWTPTQRPCVAYLVIKYTHLILCVCRDVYPTSEMRAQVQMKSGYSFWAKYRQTGEAIDLQGLFSDYWGSNKHEFTVPSQS